MDALNNIVTKLCKGISCNECSFNEFDGVPGCLLADRIEDLVSAEPDLISRQAVNEVLDQLYDNDCFAESERDIGWNNAITNVKLEIVKLPSAEPKYCPRNIN